MHAARTRIGLAGTALALSALVTGCGGDDALSEKEFRAEADKLCKAADKDTEAYGKDLSESSSEDEVKKAIDKLVDRTEKLMADIDELEEPEALSDDVESMLDSVKAALKKIDGASLEELGSMENPFAEADEKATDLGLKECGS